MSIRASPPLPLKLFLFGQIGAGKSHCGRLLARDFGFAFHDGDDDLTPAMRGAISSRVAFPPEMRRTFAEILAARLGGLATTHARFCLAQGLFKNSERHHLRATLPDLVFVWVRASPEAIAARLHTRTGHVADAAYAAWANPYFETPDFPHLTVDNHGDEAALRRALVAAVGPPPADAARLSAPA